MKKPLASYCIRQWLAWQHPSNAGAARRVGCAGGNGRAVLILAAEAGLSVRQAVGAAYCAAGKQIIADIESLLAVDHDKVLPRCRVALFDDRIIAGVSPGVM